MEENNNEINQDEKKKKIESVCYMCKRPESKAGKLINLANHITVCPDCMQKTFDALSNGSMP